MLDYFALFAVWGVLMVGYIVLTIMVVPINSLAAYSAAPKDWQHRLGLACFYAIPALWILRPTLPAAPELLAGAAYFILGGALVAWSRAANPYFLPNIVAPGEVVTRGPYRYLAHPGYFGFTYMAAGSALMFAQPLGAIPLVVYVLLLVYRAAKENRILKRCPSNSTLCNPSEVLPD